MTTRTRHRAAASLVASLLVSAGLCAQYNERPALPGSGDPAVDCSGRSIKNKRVRAVHTTDPRLPGGTAYLVERDPYLAYQLGRNLNFREFRERDGTFDLTISGLAGPMPDGSTAKITANNQVSCSGCHNLPQGNPGGGVTFHKDSGLGRNSPHYYGAGVFEMLALQIRTDMLFQIDRNRDGWVSVPEAQAASGVVHVNSTAGGPMIDFGDPGLSRGTTGAPQLNNIFRVWYVDNRGVVVPGATEVDGVDTFGYGFEMVVWGWGQGPGRSALNPTNRAFLWDPWKTHGGLEAYDPSTTNDPDGDGVSEPTLAGAVQFPVTHVAPDAGRKVDPRGFSMDDPDGDGHLNEISEGDLDLAEWFMLNAPRPAFAGTPADYARGVQELEAMGCTSCHVADWQIHAKPRGHHGKHRRQVGPDYAGDRRLFDLDVRYSAERGRLEGELVKLYQKRGPRYMRNFGAFRVEGVFTDFKHHDMGQEFSEVDFGGTVNTVWRTAPLWGVGSGFPWGHDGQSLSLEHVIERHGGEGAASRAAWRSATAQQRDAVLNLLRKLVLYDIESLPADINGDGVISTHFAVAGMDTQLERFNAEWLFRVPARIQGMFINSDGVRVPSFAVTNIDQAYGQNLALRRDSDNDGWPDVWDRAPHVPGYKNGVQ